MTSDATADTQPIPSFGSRRTICRVRTGIQRMRQRHEGWDGLEPSPVLPDPPSALVGLVDADRCPSPAAGIRRPGQAKRDPGPITTNVNCYTTLEPQRILTTRICG